MAMKYLVSLLMVLSALFVEAQTYEKIKAAVPSEKYKSIESKFSKYFHFEKSIDGRDIGRVVLEIFVEEYHSIAVKCLSERVNGVTDEKVNKIVGNFVISENFQSVFKNVLIYESSMFTEYSYENEVKWLNTCFKDSLEPWIEVYGKPGEYSVYLNDIVKAIKSSGASL